MDNMQAAPQPKSKLPVWAIVLIVVVALCILIPVCVIAILALLGPSIGNVFSNVLQNLVTATPVP
jgi:hypothetical protein